MKAEYFPPKEDVILHNEAPTDFYILVTGAVVITNFCFWFHDEGGLKLFLIINEQQIPGVLNILGRLKDYPFHSV